MANRTIEKRINTLLEQGFHCSQAVLCYAAEQYGMDPEFALRISSGLGGGCFHGETCGAVTGAVLALGFGFGFEEPYAKEQNQLLMEKVHCFEDAFIQRHGSLICRELLNGLDLAKSDSYTNPNLKSCMKNCPSYCYSACEILDEIFAAAED